MNGRNEQFDELTECNNGWCTDELLRSRIKRSSTEWIATDESLYSSLIRKLIAIILIEVLAWMRCFHKNTGNIFFLECSPCVGALIDILLHHFAFQQPTLNYTLLHHIFYNDNLTVNYYHKKYYFTEISKAILIVEHKLLMCWSDFQFWNLRITCLNNRVFV